jgi:hypothetical protein
MKNRTIAMIVAVVAGWTGMAVTIPPAAAQQDSRAIQVARTYIPRWEAVTVRFEGRQAYATGPRITLPSLRGFDTYIAAVEARELSKREIGATCKRARACFRDGVVYYARPGDWRDWRTQCQIGQAAWKAFEETAGMPYPNGRTICLLGHEFLHTRGYRHS